MLYHIQYPQETAEGYNKRIYPDRMGSWIQICGYPRGVSPWDVSFGEIIKTAKIAKIAELLKTMSICVIPLFSFHRMEDLIYLSRLTVCPRLSDCCRHFILKGLPVGNRGEQNSLFTYFV